MGVDVREEEKRSVRVRKMYVAISVYLRIILKPPFEKNKKLLCKFCFG